jgi:hypothetical protein
VRVVDQCFWSWVTFIQTDHIDTKDLLRWNLATSDHERLCIPNERETKGQHWRPEKTFFFVLGT